MPSLTNLDMVQYLLRENFRQQGDPELQQCLDELHDGVEEGEAWQILLQRVIGLLGNDDLEFKSKEHSNRFRCYPVHSSLQKSKPCRG